MQILLSKRVNLGKWFLGVFDPSNKKKLHEHGENLLLNAN